MTKEKEEPEDNIEDGKRQDDKGKERSNNQVKIIELHLSIDKLKVVVAQASSIRKHSK